MVEHACVHRVKNGAPNGKLVHFTEQVIHLRDELKSSKMG